jgi:cyclopropane fatty-acyl-phospholipid synthase-like methyltransferase
MLPKGGTVLDLGCGTGIPISELFIERGFDLCAVDASPRMVAAFRARFPEVPVECNAVEDSDFFGRTFDGVVAWGLFFLLDAEVQRRLLTRVAATLRKGGHLLFTAPREKCSWADALTGQTSVSLGYDVYRDILTTLGLSLEGTRIDEGENHYFIAQKHG